MAPILNPIPNQSTHPGFMLTFTASAMDMQGSSIQYTLVNPPAGAVINLTSGQFNWTPGWNQLGSFTVTIKATAVQTGLFDQKSCTVSVINHPPFLNAIGDQIAHPTRPLMFTANASDPDGDPLTYALINPPPGATITPQGQFNWTPAWNQVGAFNLTIRVSDPGNASDQKSFSVTVANHPPVLTQVPDQTGHPQRPLMFMANASDSDGDPLIFSLVNPPSGATITAQGQFNWTPAWSQVGAYNVTIQVSDPGGATDQKSFTITIANHAPVLNSIADQTVTHGFMLSFSAPASDSDGDPLQWSLIAPPSGATISNSGQFSWTPTAAQVQAWPMTISVSDPGGLTDQKQFTITVL